MAPTRASARPNATAKIPPRVRTRVRWKMMPSSTTRGDRGRSVSSRSGTHQSYGLGARHFGNRREPLATTRLVTCAIALWCAVLVVRRVVTSDDLALPWLLRTVVGMLVVWLVGVRWRRALTSMVVVGVVVGVPSWASSHDVATGGYVGSAIVVEEPVQVGATRIVVSIDGQRFVSYLYGRHAGAVSQCRVGDVVELHGHRAPLSSTQHDRLASRHVVGVFEVHAVASSCRSGSAVSRSVNGVRDVLASDRKSTRLNSSHT